jgi:hypothetical protein
MKYVYFLQSIEHPEHTYVGLADDLRLGSVSITLAARLTHQSANRGGL